MNKEAFVAEQLRKLDYSHTTVAKAIADAFDAGLECAGASKQEPDDVPAAKVIRRKKSE